MGAFSLHFMYLVLHNVTSIFFFSLAWLVQTHVSQVSGWHVCSVHNNFSLYKTEYLQ